MKRFSMIISFVLLCSLLCTGCRDTFRHYGEYPEYFSIGINTMLGITGSENDEIEILEQDAMGRTMFAYISHDKIDDTSGVYSIMVCQKTDSKYAYFYPDYHFVVAHTKEDITDKQIETLIETNDWNKALDETKMMKVKIVRRREQKNGRGSREEKIFKETNTVDFNNEKIIMSGLGKDKDNRWLFFVRITDMEYQYLRSYMLILNEDYSYEDTYLEEIEDVWNYQEQLKEFKELNNWSLYVE